MTRRMKVRTRTSDWEGGRRPPVLLVALLAILLAGSAMIGLHQAANRLSDAREAEAYAAELSLLVTSARAINAPGSGPVPGSQLQATQSLLALEPGVIALDAADGAAGAELRAAFATLKQASLDAQQAIATGQGAPAEIDAAVGASADQFTAAVSAARASLQTEVVRAERWFIVFAAAVFTIAGMAVGALALMVGRQRTASTNVRFREQGRFRAMTAMSNDLMSIVDQSGVVHAQSASLLRLLGRSDLWMTGRPFVDIVHPDDRAALRDLLAHVGTAPEAPSAMLRLSHGDGSWRGFQATATAVAPAEGEAPTVLLTCRETVATEPPVEQPVVCHPVSGLLTEVIFRDRLAHALVRSGRAANAVAVLAIDLGAAEQLSELSDAARTAALRAIGGRLIRAVRSSDSVGHLDEHELYILLDDTDEIVARGVAKRVLQQLEIPVSLLDHQIMLAPRIGVAVKRDPRETGEELLAAARTAATERPVDRAIPGVGIEPSIPAGAALEPTPTESPATWTAAAIGRRLQANRQTQPLSQAAISGATSSTALALVAEPATAVAPDAAAPADSAEAPLAAPMATFNAADMEIQFVPALALETGEIIELELMARWRHPQRGLISLELSGKAESALPWVLEQACRVAAAIPPTRTGAPVRMSVNLPTTVPLNDELVDLVARTLLTSGITPAALQLEVAARALDRDPAREGATRRTLGQLRALGVRVAVDGIGAEANRIEAIAALPISAVKIDRAVVSLLDRSADRRATVRAIVELAKPNGISVNGTGVETLEQAERLWDLGADEGQGPLFFRPVSEEQLQALFTSDALVAAD